jgi:hypothetical protein
MAQHDAMFTGGCKIFWSPKEWVRLNSQHESSVVLGLVYEGAGLWHWLSGSGYEWARVVASEVRKFDKMLKKLGVWREDQTSYSTAIYRV